jgi:hypothetical protein
MVEKFRYLGKNVTNQNSIQEENKYKFNSQNACYNLVQNILSSSLLSKNINIQVHRTTVFCYFVWVCILVKIIKETTWITLFVHSQNSYTCNQTLKRKWRDNFNDIRECIWWKEIISLKEMSVLSRNKCYILSYIQRTDPYGEVKYCPTAMPLTLPLVPKVCALCSGHSYKVS